MEPDKSTLKIVEHCQRCQLGHGALGIILRASCFARDSTGIPAARFVYPRTTDRVDCFRRDTRNRVHGGATNSAMAQSRFRRRAEELERYHRRIVPRLIRESDLV